MGRQLSAVFPSAATRANSVPLPGALPSWRSGMSVNQWLELSGTSLSNQPTMGSPFGTNVSGKVEAWCAHAADTRQNALLSVGQGGHTNYHGREVERLVLTVDTPVWEQVIGPGTSGNVTSTSTYYSDGIPASQHGYNGSIYVDSIRAVLRFYGGSIATSGNASQRITAYYTETEAYGTSGTWDSLAAPASIDIARAAYALKRSTGEVYCWINNTALARWNPGEPGTFTTLVSGGSMVNRAAYYSCADHDSSRDVCFFLGGADGGGGLSHRYNIGANTFSTITLTGTDISGQDGMQMFYVAALDKYIAIGTSGTSIVVYEISPTSGTSWACSVLTTTGGSGLPSITAGEQLPFGKPQYFPDLGVIAYHPRWTSNVWALRLH